MIRFDKKMINPVHIVSVSDVQSENRGNQVYFHLDLETVASSRRETFSDQTTAEKRRSEVLKVFEKPEKGKTEKPVEPGDAGENTNPDSEQ